MADSNILNYIKSFIIPHAERVPLNKARLLQAKNLMLAANFLANFISLMVINSLSIQGGPKPAKVSLEVIQAAEAIFIPGIFILIGFFMLLYEHPTRSFLNLLYEEKPIPPDLALKARRRLLNEPFYIVAIVLFTWLTTGIVFSLFYWAMGENRAIISRIIFTYFNTGLITSAIVFFIMEHVINSHLTQYFFPEGGLSKVPGTIRVKIVVRLLALIIAANIIPFLTFLQMAFVIGGEYYSQAKALEILRNSIVSNSLIYISVGLITTFFVGHCLTSALQEVIRVLDRVRKGDFNVKVQIMSNDEIGYTGEVINEMTEGLLERDRMRQSLLLAQEVQQNLLPKKPPSVPGLDVFGRTIYCDETGGDYFDYIPIGDTKSQRLCLVVGDVSDHGVQASLLMVSVRATLRHHLHHSEDLEEIIRDLNRHFYQDALDSGQFMTLFAVDMDRPGLKVRWANAGHEPALLYNTKTGRFSTLAGGGPALGVVDDFEFELHEREIEPGNILIMATDGVWEAESNHGDLFGKENLRSVIRVHQDAPASEIVQAILDQMELFCRSDGFRDDVSLMVVKVLD